MRGLVVLAATLAVALVFVSSAPAEDLPTLGTTTTVRCIFVPDDDFLSPGITYCSQEIVTISGGDCYTDGYRLYYQDEIHSVREYRGNVVLPGFNGVEVEGEFGDVVRPNAKLISDVGGVTFFAFFVPDESCTV